MSMPKIEVILTAVATRFNSAMATAERRMDGFRGATDETAKRLALIGDRMEALGKRFSVASAALTAGAGGAFLLAQRTADSARQIERLAAISNASTTEFQRMAAGARTVGIEQDKLADIFKDVNDRVGDFITTGGGPMADFFEKIAPKVGVTAEQFAKLSGPEALQLYVSSLEKAGLSQQEMTFFMEAMAGDATALIPLLANGGKAMDAYGDAAQNAGAVMDESAIKKSAEFNDALGRLMNSFSGVKMRFGEALMPVFTDLMNGINEHVIPPLNDAVTAISGWIDAFGGLDPAVQTAIGAFVAAFAVGGPIVLAIGATATALSGIVAFLGPAGLIAAGLAAAGAVWATYGEEIKSAVGGAIDWVSAKFEALKAVMQTVVDKAVAVKTAIAEALMPQAGISNGVFTGGFGAQPDLGQGYGIGQNMGQGMISGLGQSITDGEAELREYIDRVPQIARDQLGIQSPSRVFRRIGSFLSEGLAAGISDGTNMVMSAVSQLGSEAAAGMNAGVDGILGAMQTLFQGNAKIGAAIAWVSTLIGAAKELEKGTFGFATMAAVLSKGAALVSAINSARPGSGSSGAGAGASGGGASSSTAAPPPEVTYNVYMSGQTDPTRQMFEMFNDGIRRGYRIAGINVRDY